MKKYALLCCGLVATEISCAQTTEVSVHLTSGLSSFRGAAATTETGIMVPDNEALPPDKYLYTLMDVPYASDPFGKKLGLSYGAAAQVQHVTARHLVFGAQGGYEVLRSHTPIFVVFDKHDFGLSAKGKATLANHFLNLHPFLGYRLIRKGLEYDLTVGPEFGWLQRSHETATATLSNYSTNSRYTTDLNRKQRRLDTRARFNATVYYHRLGLSLGYSFGLSKYQPDYAGSADGIYAQVFRTGIAYRIGM